MSVVRIKRMSILSGSNLENLSVPSLEAKKTVLITRWVGVHKARLDCKVILSLGPHLLKFHCKIQVSVGNCLFDMAVIWSVAK